MNKLLIGLLMFLTLSMTGLAQETKKNDKKISFRKHTKILAKEEINQLKDGILLVRLKTKKLSIIALRKMGKINLADEIETKQDNLNKTIIAGFRNNFDYCPTYFFFSEYLQNIRERKFDQVTFLNDSLKADTTIKINNNNFLTAEFGTIEQDTTKYFSHYSYETDGNWGLKKVENYYGGPNMRFGALVIKSDQIIQLRRPFPYYVRTFNTLPIKRKPKKVIQKMNKKLNKFYKNNNK